MRNARSWVGWLLWSSLTAGAHEAMPVIEVVAQYGNSAGSGNSASQGVINAERLDNQPLLRPGDLLATVPGMVVTQHSGDGKANQYFLRGFNLDHGSDFASSLNGMPINMPTHAHGHGYTDLNFLIPELVQRVDYRKGPYTAQDGDFASAGAADFHYKTRLDQDTTVFTLGQRGYERGLVAASHPLGNGMQYVAAMELMHNNGPWSVPEHLHRRNGVFMLSDGSRANGWTASVMHYSARWNATDQIPLTMVDAGQLGRFDSLDPSDGGRTQRSSASLDWRQTHGDVADKVLLYVIRNDLALFSNFSYYSEHPLSGDQFMQQEQRQVLGLKASRQWASAGDDRWLNTLGFQIRSDAVDLDLANSQSRQVSDWIRRDTVHQTLSGFFGETQVQWAPWLRSQVGLRGDVYHAQVERHDAIGSSGSASDVLWSPKLGVVWGPWHNTEYFFNAGYGFHSNDARGAANPHQPAPALVRAKGYEVGAQTQWTSGWQSSIALWQLHFDSELVYAADAGTTEAGAASRRTGVELSNHWTPNPQWVVDAEMAWTRPRFISADGLHAYIPNAVEQVAMLAATVKNLHRWNLTVQWRHIGSAALADDNSVRSAPSNIINIKARTQLDARNALQVDVFNALNQRYQDIAYLGHNLKPYADPNALVLSGNQVQVHPGEPRTLRVTYSHTY